MIIIVVSVSTLGFILGYFVGKAVTKQESGQTQAVAIPVPVPAEITPVIPQEPTKEKLEVLPQENKTEQIITEETKKPDKNVQKTPPAKPEEEVVTASTCTVQVGAFKNSKDAEALKQRLENKGYKVYIKKSASTKNAKLYKVRVGRFTAREDADVLVQKLKKTEGLKAFVTFITSEDNENYNSKRSSSKEKPR